MKRKLVFLKLGGSLITVKEQPYTPRQAVLERLAREIAQALAQDGDLQVLLGHGSGSFGHVPADQYKTRLGVRSAEEWRGFVEVWHQAAELNHLTMQALAKAGLPALAFHPMTMVIARHGMVASWTLEPLKRALQEGLLPVIHGDVVFDVQLGGTILSTEDLFSYLAAEMHPRRLLFAGIQAGVWEDFPHNTSLLTEITPASFKQIEPRLRGSSATDVTGGMAEKVRQIITMVEAVHGLEAAVFSGEEPGNVSRALLGENVGTSIHT